MDTPQATPPPSTRPLVPQLVPATGVYLTGEDVVRLVSWNSLAGVALTVRLRILTMRNEIQIVPFFQVPNTDRTAKTTDSNPIEGWLLGASVEASTGAPARGQCFATLRLARGIGPAAFEIATIAADYVTSQQRLSYPHSGVRSSLDGQGYLRSFTGTDQGAGAEVSETVPTGARWRLMSMAAILVTDATVSNRTVSIILDDGANVFFQAYGSTLHAGSQTFRYVFGPLGTQVAGASISTVIVGTPIKGIALAGWRFRTSTNNFQAGDNWQAPQLAIEEYLEAA